MSATSGDVRRRLERLRMTELALKNGKETMIKELATSTGSGINDACVIVGLNILLEQLSMEVNKCLDLLVLFAKAEENNHNESI